ncbi:hypothetical protein ACN4EK_26425 [Pantanalinema rosaneae CENA516]|uniref:hypothetical protein n=1 Tax=Pantanalinema rosaneae TaxID=1620701 RepID=UPI003D6ECDF1
MYYHNELFCQLGCFHSRDRPQVYQVGSRLAQKGAVITITCSPTTCCLWGSLRADSVKQLLLNPTALQIPRVPSSLLVDSP